MMFVYLETSIFFLQCLNADTVHAGKVEAVDC